MSILIISLLIQVAFIIHVIKTGRNFLWIWVLIIPGIAVPGIIAYIAIEIIPGLMKSRTAQRTARGFKKALDPGRDLRRYENEARLGANVASRQRYAEELVRHGRYEDAIGQYRQALTGLYEHDPNLMGDPNKMNGTWYDAPSGTTPGSNSTAPSCVSCALGCPVSQVYFGSR